MNVDELTGWQLKLLYLMTKAEKQKKSYSELRQDEEKRMREYIKRSFLKNNP